jgi:hypothetical protein
MLESVVDWQGSTDLSSVRSFYNPDANGCNWPFFACREGRLPPNWGVAALGLNGISRDLSLGFVGDGLLLGQSGVEEYRVVYLWDMRCLVSKWSVVAWGTQTRLNARSIWGKRVGIGMRYEEL